MFRFLFKLILVTALLQTILYAEEVKVFEFTDKELSELTVRKVRGADNKTTYSVGSNENGNFLKAVAETAPSGIGNSVAVSSQSSESVSINRKAELTSRLLNITFSPGHITAVLTASLISCCSLGSTTW